MKVLVVDDDPDILETLMLSLRFQWSDCTVVPAQDGQTGLSCLSKLEPDLVLLDVGLPDRDGFEVLRDIRRSSEVPVIMLTGRDSDMDQVRGFELGADGYVTKPYSQLVLLSQIRAVLRRSEMTPPSDALPDFVVGDLAINFHNCEVRVRGERVKLTPVEYKLLHALAGSPGRLVPHRKLLELVWGGEYRATLDHLHVYINRLRSKIEPDPNQPRYIENERGHGYRFMRTIDFAEAVN